MATIEQPNQIDERLDKIESACVGLNRRQIMAVIMLNLGIYECSI